MLFSNFWYIVAALIPVLIIIFYVFKQDQFPEPKRIVFKTFIFGAAIVLALNLILGDVDKYALTYFKGETFNFFDNFIRAAFLEEFFKMIVMVFSAQEKMNLMNQWMDWYMVLQLLLALLHMKI